jgi:hypothetical protein
MPVRLLREGILTSDRVDLLDAPAEVFYRRLMSKVDDHGLYDARPSVLRSSLYPLRVDRVREADISRWIAACEKAGVIALYQHDAKPYLLMLDTRWAARSEAKYPLPPANIRSQLQTTATVDVFEDVVVDEEKKGARKRSPGFDPLGIELPDWLLPELWARWCKDRKDRRKPVTEEGAKSQLSKLAAYRADGIEPRSVIEHSIAGGYQGLFAPPAAKPGQAVVGVTVASNAADVTAQTYLNRREKTPEEKAAADAARAAAMAKVKRIAA